MATNDERQGTAQHGDDDRNIQRELEREAREGHDAVGDVSSNRNLSGSSTWDTLPEDESTNGSSDSSRRAE